MFLQGGEPNSHSSTVECAWWHLSKEYSVQREDKGHSYSGDTRQLPPHPGDQGQHQQG